MYVFKDDVVSVSDADSEGSSIELIDDTDEHDEDTDDADTEGVVTPTVMVSICLICYYVANHKSILHFLSHYVLSSILIDLVLL